MIQSLPSVKPQSETPQGLQWRAVGLTQGGERGEEGVTLSGSQLSVSLSLLPSLAEGGQGLRGWWTGGGGM